MKINKIQINGFGNIAGKNMEFSDGINVIKGNNEAGKSTLMHFIKAMFYGINKNKSGEIFSELERYKPWQNSDFSGRIDYIIKNEKYSVFRDFNRNNTKVYDEFGNEITGEFNIDKSRGAEVGFAQFGIDEETFMNSVFISQGNVKLDNNEKNSIIQKLTNIIQSGDEANSYDKAKQKLHKFLIEEVGTERTHNKPINVVTREIDVLEKARDTLLFNREKKENINDNKKEIAKELELLKKETEQLEKVFEVKDRYSKLINEREKEYEISLKLLEKEKEEKIKRKKNIKKQLILILLILYVILVGILIYYKYYLMALLPAALMFISWIIIENVFSMDVKIKTPQDIDVIKENLKRKENKELELLNKEDISTEITNLRLQQVKDKITEAEKKRTELILETHKLDIENDGVNEHVERLNDVEEQLNDLYEKEEELRKLEYAIKIATCNLDSAYEELKSDIVPHIEESIKENIAQTTNGAYVNTKYNDRVGLLVETNTGELMNIEKLSIGTIDQMYLGFRFAISEKVNNIPIFLDETFVYYDDERLENILEVLDKKAQTSQIFILTCSDREIRALNKKGIKYNEIKI